MKCVQKENLTTSEILYEVSKRLEMLEEEDLTTENVVGVSRIKTKNICTCHGVCKNKISDLPYLANKATNTTFDFAGFYDNQHPEGLTYEIIHQNYLKHFPELLSGSKNDFTCLSRASSQDKIDPILDSVKQKPTKI